jgi:dolichyl-phosphate-mannose-protein mannosyltransferase
VHQASAWATARLRVVEPLALEAPWPDAPLTFAPAGHIPSPTLRGAIAPICPAGLSLAMVPFVWAGEAGEAGGAGKAGGAGAASGVFVVVPLFGVLLVWSTYLLGARFSSRVGLASALLLACSPAFLFQLMQPMSDVPAAALWVLAIATATSGKRRSSLMAGLAASAAIAVRPNLLPMGVVLGWFLLLRPERPLPERARDAATFAAASLPGCLLVAVIQHVFYGSPLRSGYGTLTTLFAAEHIVPNATRYATWMWQSHGLVWLLALAAPFMLRGWLTALLLSLVVVNIACYLPYAVFNDWWYLRFLLPGIAILLVMAIAVVDALLHLSRKPSWLAHWPTREGLIVFAIVICVFFLREARTRNVYDLQRLEARYERAGLYVDSHLPPDALVVTSWESGSIRYYGHRNTLVWDSLDQAWLDRALAYVRTRGYEPYLVFERWEEPIFRQRFAGSTIARLDWPPAAEIAGQVRIYRPDDRERYLNGTSVPTEYAR